MIHLDWKYISRQHAPRLEDIDALASPAQAAGNKDHPNKGLLVKASWMKHLDILG